MTTTPLSRPRPPARAVRLPSGWVSFDPASPPDDLVPGLPAAVGVLAAVTPRRLPASGSRPALVLARSSTPTDVDASLLDEDDHFLDDGGRTVRYRRWQAATDLRTVCESWAWAAADGTETALLAAVDIADYSCFTDVFETVAESVDPEAF
ncbi:hypothetical protein [uncultured Nocardioides sp.]|uniref:hypothetical protein n=1 Tax=uncultured Nocardioides sp. TaxID=198441 RepID=UPI002605A9A4|nr:hypothetical protein [uncultured Nocardioides sp.]